MSGKSKRWVRTLLKRLRREGDKALRHRLRGRPSNRKTPEAVKRRVVELFRQKQQARPWHDCGRERQGWRFLQKRNFLSCTKPELSTLR
jgi:hypothetical protein